MTHNHRTCTCGDCKEHRKEWENYPNTQPQIIGYLHVSSGGYHHFIVKHYDDEEMQRTVETPHIASDHHDDARASKRDGILYIDFPVVQYDE